MSFNYCIFDKTGYCSICKFKISNYNDKLETIRECRPEATDMPLIRTFQGNPCFFKNIFEGQSIFYIGAGPSLKEVDLSFLSSRGILSFAVNNIAAWDNIKPNFWMCADETSQFHEVIWKDGSIWKFIPEHFSGKPFKLVDGKWSKYAKRLCPNTWTFTLNENFKVAEFLTEDTVSFGCSKDKTDDIGISGSRSTMLAAIKIMFYLGFKNIFLLGCDFNMEENNPYIFPQKKHKAGVYTNNECYQNLNKRYKALVPKLKGVGVTIHNCTKNSKLTAFPFLPVSEAIELSLKDFCTGEISLENMYG